VHRLLAIEVTVIVYRFSVLNQPTPLSSFNDLETIKALERQVITEQFRSYYLSSDKAAMSLR
jgi:hypothetical protein